MTPSSNPKILYAILYEVLKNGEWQAREEYTHAENAHRAKVAWAQSIPRSFKIGFNVKLVGVAPVIGVHTDVINRGTKDEKEIYVA